MAKQGKRRDSLLAVALFGVAALFAAGTVAILLLSGGEDDSDLGMLETQRPNVGEMAPDFALEDVRDEGTVRRLSDYRGQAVVLNWYATWCGPCEREIPAFQEAQDALGDEVVFLLVNLQQTRADAVGFLEVLDATMVSVLDSNGEVYDHYRGVAMPTTYFIDEAGRVQSSGSGYVPEDTLREELAALGLEY